MAEASGHRWLSFSKELDSTLKDSYSGGSGLASSAGPWKNEAFIVLNLLFPSRNGESSDATLPPFNRRDFVSLKVSLGGYLLLKGTLARAVEPSPTPDSEGLKALVRYPKRRNSSY